MMIMVLNTFQLSWLSWLRLVEFIVVVLLYLLTSLRFVISEAFQL
jgi:hypothetical protein